MRDLKMMFSQAANGGVQDFLKSLANFTGKHLLEFLFNKAAGLRSPSHVFNINF